MKLHHHQPVCYVNNRVVIFKAKLTVRDYITKISPVSIISSELVTLSLPNIV